MIKIINKVLNFLFNRAKQIENSSLPKSQEIIKLQKNNETKIIGTNILRSEFNFIKYPFFDLSPSKKRISEIKFEHKDKYGNKISWNVFPSSKNKLPSIFARKIHKEVIEKKINILDKPIGRLIPIGSLSEICRKIDLKSRETNRVRNALKDIALTNIEAKSTLKLKDKIKGERYIEGIFHLYDGVYFIGDVLPSGEMAEECYVMLSDFYVQNLNNFFSVPLDYDYLSFLSDVASRLYELLSIWFYGAIKSQKDDAQKDYTYICKSLPLVPQNEKWKAKKQLKSAHQQLLDSKYLGCEPEWVNIGKREDWGIKYIIGERAKKWYERTNKKSKEIDMIEEKRCIDQTYPAIIHDVKQDSIFKELTQIRIQSETARGLLQKYSKEKIQDWLNALDYLETPVKNRPGFFIKALEKDWELPPSYLREKKRKENELKEEYNKFVLSKADEIILQMSKSQLKEELTQHENIFFEKYSKYREFEGKEAVYPLIVEDYKKEKSKELDIISFDDWCRQQS